MELIKRQDTERMSERNERGLLRVSRNPFNALSLS